MDPLSWISRCGKSLSNCVLLVHRSCSIYISHSTRKPTLWMLRVRSTRISLSMLRRLTRTDTLSHPLDFLFHESFLYTSIPLRRNMPAQISMRGLHRLILVDTLRRIHNVGSIVERLIYVCLIFHLV